MQKVLIIGATSAIAEATARLYASRGDALYLMARDKEHLAVLSRDLVIRGARDVATAVFDSRTHEFHRSLLESAVSTMDGIDVILVAHGTLPDQAACEKDPARMREAFEINALGTMSLATVAANLLEAQGSGTLAVIGSVAGDRGRKSNYVYGASKAALHTFLQGLRNRLAGKGVRVITIKPGFVDTPMTAAFEKGPLWTAPETIARGIVDAIDRGRDVAYLPWFWRLIMLVIASIPERVFKRLSL
jgi:decaprenylphospho-beta-D-erythro-pentofuranosid-2-ulose 2-reductase